MVEAGEAPFGDAGTAGQRELLQGARQRVEAAETPVVHVGTALQCQGLELLQGQEVVQAVVVDGTATGIYSLHGHRLELQDLSRETPALL